MSNLTTQFKRFHEGIYIDSDGNESWCYNFYDWFCHDDSLQNKANKLFPAAKKFAKTLGLDHDEHYVFFKNNCPLFANLYDDFRFVNRKQDRVVYTVVPRRRANDGTCTAEVWGLDNEGEFRMLWEGPNLTQYYKDRKQKIKDQVILSNLPE